MILFIYLLGVLASVYVTLSIVVRMADYYHENITDDSMYLTLVVLISLFSWVGAVISLVALFIDNDWGVLKNSKPKISPKIMEFIKKITL